MTKKWFGSVFPRGRKLYLKIKLGKEWVQRPTPLYVGQEDQAEKLLARVRERIAAGDEIEDPTVRGYGRQWLDKRRAAGLDDDGHDETRLRLHVYPIIGDMLLTEVRPRHVLAVVDAATRKEKAARTVRNVYSVMSSMFRDALIADLIETTPCVLRRPHLPKILDKHTEWRRGAVFDAKELRQLTASVEVPEERRVLYGLLGLAMLRHGEAAGLRWRNVDPTQRPLGRLLVATSYDNGRTKTGAERWVPVHRALAALLAAWRLTGWRAMFGRAPGPDDLVLPREPDRLGLGGTMRSKEHTHHRWRRDLGALGLRHRRLHDLRRTGITLAREGGADRDVLRLVTHTPPRDVMELYTSLGWERLCDQVAVLALPRARATG